MIYRQYKPKLMITSMGKAVFITGCDTGFGHRLALRLNERGFRVYATVLSESSPGAQQLAKSARFGQSIHVMEMNVTDDLQVQNVYQQVKKHLLENTEGDSLWAIVNNAGIAMPSPVEWGTLDTFERVMAVNTFGVLRVTRTFLPLIKASKGRVVNVASMAGRVSLPTMGSYNMSKHAVVALSDTLRRELRGFGVQVVTIEPAFFRTNITDCKANADYLVRTWDQTPVDVQQTYGQKYLETQRQQILHTHDLAHSGNDIDVVVNDMIDAVQSAKPSIRYTPIGSLMAKLMTWACFLMPSEWLDRFISLMDKAVPDGCN